MRKIMIKWTLVACILFLGIVVCAQTSSNPIGMWIYSCPDAPDEYATGKVEFKQQDGKLMLLITVNQADGSQITEVTKKDNVYTCRLSSEYFDITITLSPDGENLKGTILSDQMEVPITMKPAKK